MNRRGQAAEGSSRVHYHHHPSRAEHPGRLDQGFFHRLEIAKHAGGPYSVKSAISKRETLAFPHHPLGSGVDGEHRPDRIERHHLPMFSEERYGHAGPRSQIQEETVGKTGDTLSSPSLVLAQGEDPVESVIPLVYPRENVFGGRGGHCPYGGSIRSKPR